MGDPLPVRASGPRTHVRYCPSTRIPLPSHAAAAACLPTSGPPAFFGTRSAVRYPFIRYDRDRSPSRTTRRATTWFPLNAGVLPRQRGYPAPCGSLAIGGIAPIRALPRIWRTVPCDASTARRALRRGTESVISNPMTPSRRALPSRQRRAWRLSDAGHLNTASSRQHQQNV